MVIFQQYSLHHKRTVLLENFKHIANCEKSVPYASLYNFFLVDIVLVRWISLQAKRTHFVEPNLNAKHVLILWRRHDLRKKNLVQWIITMKTSEGGTRHGKNMELLREVELNLVQALTGYYGGVPIYLHVLHLMVLATLFSCSSLLPIQPPYAERW